jgi:hypothetical protein
LVSTEVAKRIASLCTVKDVRNLLKELEVQGYKWSPVGGRPNNTGTIDQGSDPAEAVTERITNAIDAILEREWRERHYKEAQPSSPREAAEMWFKIKQGHLSNIPSDPERRKLAERIKVTLHESGFEREPTISIVDKGVGQHPSAFTDTLLSLNQGNKIDKHFLMGAYGQGGATVYAFSGYTVLISRRVPSLLTSGQPDMVGWTVVRFNPLDDDHKNGTYEFLVTQDGKVPSFSPNIDPTLFAPGTQIRMIQYMLPKNFTIFTAPSASLWSLANMVLPDPVLPFLIGDERTETYTTLKKKSQVQRTRPIVGSINRLRDNVAKKVKAEAEEEEVKVKVLHNQECKVSLGEYGQPVIRYWILGPSEGGKSIPVDAFTDAQSALMVTLSGQRQAKFDRGFFRLQLGLPILKDYMLIQIDCDGLSKAGKKSLFSTNRTEIKKVELLDALLAEVVGIILKDPYVKEIADQLQEAALKSASSERNTRLSHELEKLIKEWEMSEGRKVITGVGPRMVYDENGRLTTLTLHRQEGTDIEPDDDDDEQRAPRPTRAWLGKYFPSEFDFVVKREPLRIPLARHRKQGKRQDAELWVKPYTIWFETDAMDDSLTRDKDAGEMTLATKPTELLNERTRSHMKGGRIFIRVVPTEAAAADAQVEITATLSFPGRTPLTAKRKPCS